MSSDMYNLLADFDQSPLNSNHTSDKIKFYSDRETLLVHLLWYQGLINNPVLILSSLYVLYKVLFVRKRYEMFLVLIPIFFSINSFWWFINSLGQLTWGLDYFKYLIIGDITLGLYSLSHWIFAA